MAGDFGGANVISLYGGYSLNPNVSIEVWGSQILGNFSNRFFSHFDGGDVHFDGGSHDGYLSDAEKRLIAEWLDVGAQYYNNPFDVPQN